MGTRLLAAALLLIVVGATSHAQTVRLTLGDSAGTFRLAGSSLKIPLRVRVLPTDPAELSSFTARVEWPAGSIGFDSVTAIAGTGVTITPGTSSVGSGVLIVSGVAAAPITGSLDVANIWLRVRSVDALCAAIGCDKHIVTSSALLLTVTDLTGAAGTNLLPKHLSRGVDVCAVPFWRVGDTNGDGVVNIIDAQQIARFSIGLSVLVAASVRTAGDVTGDGSLNILDAQQLARFAVGLSAPVGIGLTQEASTTVGTLSLAPATVPQLPVGSGFYLRAALESTGGRSISGCRTVQWTSSDSSVVAVENDGFLRAKAGGAATITATHGAVTSSVGVSVVTTTGLRVSTSWNFASKRLFIVADSGGLAAPVWVKRVLTGSERSLTTDIDLPAGTDYRVRVLVADSNSVRPDSLPLIRAGQQRVGLSVTAGARTAVSAPATELSITEGVPSTWYLGDSLRIQWTLRDPTGLFAIGCTGTRYFHQTSTVATRDRALANSVEACASRTRLTDSTWRATDTIPRYTADSATVRFQFSSLSALVMPDPSVPGGVITPMIALPSVERRQTLSDKKTVLREAEFVSLGVVRPTLTGFTMRAVVRPNGWTYAVRFHGNQSPQGYPPPPSRDTVFRVRSFATDTIELTKVVPVCGHVQVSVTVDVDGGFNPSGRTAQHAPCSHPGRLVPLVGAELVQRFTNDSTPSQARWRRGPTSIVALLDSTAWEPLGSGNVEIRVGVFYYGNCATVDMWAEVRVPNRPPQSPTTFSINDTGCSEHRNSTLNLSQVGIPSGSGGLRARIEGNGLGPAVTESGGRVPPGSYRVTPLPVTLSSGLVCETATPATDFTLVNGEMVNFQIVYSCPAAAKSSDPTRF